MQQSENLHTGIIALVLRISGLFGRHAADVMRWPRGRRGCWPPPGHFPGRCHIRKWSSAGANKECLHGRYRVGVGIVWATTCCTACTYASSMVSAQKVPERWPAFCSLCNKLLRSRMGLWRSRGSRSTTPSQDGRNVGGSQTAPSVSTWPAIQEQDLESASGWSCG